MIKDFILALLTIMLLISCTTQKINRKSTIPIKVKLPVSSTPSTTFSATPTFKDTTLQNKKDYWVKVNHLNVRSKPSIYSEVITVIKKGTHIKGISKKDKWIKDKITKGWIHSDYLSDKYVETVIHVSQNRQKITINQITQSMDTIMEYSPLADGRPRYLGQTPTNCSIECIGSRTDVKSATLVLLLSTDDLQVIYNALTTNTFLENTIGNLAINWFQDVSLEIANKIEYDDEVIKTKWFGKKKVKIIAYSYGMMLIKITFN